MFPAKLKVFEKDGKYKMFDNPQAAAEGLREYGVKVKIPTGEADLESVLQAAGWQIKRSGNKKAPDNDYMSGMKHLLDSMERHGKDKDK